jgi:hypothetical protein
LDALGNSDLLEDSSAITESNNQIIVYGKALYPGFFKADEDLLDDRVGRVPDPGQSRVMFHLVGMENIWVSLPINAPPDRFAHAEEVIILGSYERNSERNLNEGKHPYFLARELYFLLQNETGEKLLNSVH